MRLCSLVGWEGSPVGVVPAEELPLVADSEGSVGEFMDGDGATNEVQAAARRRELKDPVLKDHGVVVADNAVVLDREQQGSVKQRITRVDPTIRSTPTSYDSWRQARLQAGC